MEVVQKPGPYRAYLKGSVTPNLIFSLVGQQIEKNCSLAGKNVRSRVNWPGWR